jgi:hypothetical protein
MLLSPFPNKIIYGRSVGRSFYSLQRHNITMDTFEAYLSPKSHHQFSSPVEIERRYVIASIHWLYSLVSHFLFVCRLEKITNNFKKVLHPNPDDKCGSAFSDQVTVGKAGERTWTDSPNEVVVEEGGSSDEDDEVTILVRCHGSRYLFIHIELFCFINFK